MLFQHPHLLHDHAAIGGLDHVVDGQQADLYGGITSARDMASHSNGYADVDIRNAINDGELDGPRFQVSGRGIVWGAQPANGAPNPRAAIVVRSAEEGRAAVREHVEKNVDHIKLYPGGAYSFGANGEPWT